MSTPEKVEAFYRTAFQPMPQASSITDNAAVNLRTAHAAEYAAAQLGTIARAAEKIESHLAKIAAHYPVPGSADHILQSALSPTPPQRK
jgi:hypothetical protein